MPKPSSFSYNSFTRHYHAGYKHFVPTGLSGFIFFHYFLLPGFGIWDFIISNAVPCPPQAGGISNIGNVIMRFLVAPFVTSLGMTLVIGHPSLDSTIARFNGLTKKPRFPLSVSRVPKKNTGHPSSVIRQYYRFNDLTEISIYSTAQQE